MVHLEVIRFGSSLDICLDIFGSIFKIRLCDDSLVRLIGGYVKSQKFSILVESKLVGGLVVMLVEVRIDQSLLRL